MNEREKKMNPVLRRFAVMSASVLLFTLSPAYAAEVDDASEIVSEASTLRPGEYVWQPDRARSGEVEVVVSLPLQRAYVYRGDTLIGVATVSTGRAGYDTPVGSFNILQKRREHYSNRYNNAPMPFMQRLTWDGIALHGGPIPGRPASHGCIRLPTAFARRLFAETELGAAVHVTDLAPPSAELALAMVRPGGAYTGMGGPEEPIGDD
jgi:lipoprotein-anchoring transpeptidase ErfK/SrfK